MDNQVFTLDRNRCSSSPEYAPTEPRSSFAITGLYFCDNKAVSIAKTLTPSSRGELEITDVLNHYLESDTLHVSVFGRGFAWLDTGTPESLQAAGQFVQTVEERQGLKIACLEEIAFRKGWLKLQQVAARAELIGNTSYGRYLKRVIDGYA